MKIYVAAPYSWAPRVQVMYMHLKDMGHTITHDWTTAEENTGAEPDITPEKMGQHATADIDGATGADLLILFVSKTMGTGCFLEAGAALGAGVPVIVIGYAERYSIFWHHPKVIARVWSETEALEIVSKM